MCCPGTVSAHAKCMSVLFAVNKDQACLWFVQFEAQVLTCVVLFMSLAFFFLEVGRAIITKCKKSILKVVDTLNSVHGIKLDY